MSRSVIAALVLGAAALMAPSVLFAQVDSPMSTLSIHNFTFTPQTSDGPIYSIFEVL